MTSLKSHKVHVGIFKGGTLLFFVGSFFILPSVFATTYEGIASAIDAVIPTEDPIASVPHLPTPPMVKAVYMTQCAVGTPSLRNSLVELIDRTELNAVVIDIKDYTGYIAFPTDNPILADSVSKKCGASDMKKFLEVLHAKGIYVIGRITVFQDPRYTKLYPEQSVQSKSRPGEPWKDHKGLSFIDPTARPYWDYVVELSKYSYQVIGFDELNYDYIRWPSDGPMADVAYPNVSRAEAIEKFFAHLHKEVRPIGVAMSADLFGFVTTNVDDLSIGQVLERALPYFDFIDPMVYPSHYPKSFLGLGDPNKYPYEVVHYAMERAVVRTVATTTKVEALTHTPIMEEVIVPAEEGVATTTKQKFSGLYSKPPYPASKMRPWLQSFNYPVTYTPDMVSAQIKANTDAGLDSYLFWAPANKYTALREVLAPEVVGE